MILQVTSSSSYVSAATHIVLCQIIFGVDFYCNLKFCSNRIEVEYLVSVICVKLVICHVARFWFVQYAVINAYMLSIIVVRPAFLFAP